MICTLTKFQESIKFKNEDLFNDMLHNVEESVPESDNLNSKIMFYAGDCYRSISDNDVDYVFGQDSLETRLGTL